MNTTEPQPAPQLSRYERLQQHIRAVAPNDFAATEEEYFAGNGRPVRLRPPRDGEHAKLVRSLQLLELVPFVLIRRANPQSPPRQVALLGLNQDVAATLPTELMRMPADAYIALTRRPGVFLHLLEG